MCFAFGPVKGVLLSAHGLTIAKLHACGLEQHSFKLLFFICVEGNSVLKFQLVEVHGQC